MITLTTLVIAGVFLIAAILAAIFVPHPITWLATIILGGLFFFILLPKYKGQQQAIAQGVEIQAMVEEVRTWRRKVSDHYANRYEIIASAHHPQTGEMVRFVSPPMEQNPEPYLSEYITVKVDWSNPNAYVMDLSFLPFAIP
ncbi:hypothetical protein [Neisseria montereyensis]|uniref:DUF3592 domain-containing protein n=1 Tax=Neisseria montereyensis TaxID=2973938 RepID=A0ABT2FDT7_9NEIS|nr:hypothetical protein [Neisseria montereyensis]MCS4533909.1 hypothetical protein [Neisseria montereyensis]